MSHLQKGLEKLAQIRAAQSQSKVAPDNIPFQLWDALQECAKAEDRLAEHLEVLEKDRAKRKAKVSLDYLDWQKETLTKRTRYVAQEAKKRIAYIEKLDSPEKWEREKERCRTSSLHWFKYWAWTVDQREDFLPVIPFLLFPFQEDALEWLEELIFLRRSDGYIDKSRDMGMSWMMTAFSIKHFLFSPRFDALFGSRIENLVDAVGRLDSIFEKFRFQLRMQPNIFFHQDWAWSQHVNFCRIVNPATGSVLAGEAPTQNFGRAGRYLYIFADELAAWPHEGREAWAAMSQSSRSKIVVTTPQGKINQAADLRFKTDIPVKSYHWEKHPWKDARWYEFQKTTMSREMIAQELDIDYEASQPGQIFPMWSELHSVITWSEFAEYFGDAALDDYGSPRIPLSWSLAMGQDVGITVDHKCANLWVTRPAEGFPLRDCVFIYRHITAPVGNSVRQNALAIRKAEAPQREHQRMTIRLNSHEAGSERLTYLEHGISFEPWDTDYNAGIAQLQNYMELRLNVAHPFKKDLTSRPRLFLIVEDTQGRLLWDEASERYRIEPAEDDSGMKWLREEIPMYHYPASEEGKPVQARRPFKGRDDFVDVLRGLAIGFFPQSTALDDEARIEKALHPDLRLENLKPDKDFGVKWLSRKFAIAEQEEFDDMGGGSRSSHWRSKFWSN